MSQDYCVQELQELGDLANNFPPTPELERITFYPNYPVGPRGNHATSLVRISLSALPGAGADHLLPQLFDGTQRNSRNLSTVRISLIAEGPIL